MRILITIIIITFCILLPAGALADKPAPQPYPAPEQQGAQAYPPPEATPVVVTPTPGPTPTAQPVVAWPDPRLGVPYAWGYLAWIWPVTIQGVGFGSDITGTLCVRKIGTLIIRCYPLMWTGYVYATDTNDYRAVGMPCLTGGWEVYSVYAMGMYGDIRQPNVYSPTCRQMLPIWQQG